MSEAHPFLSADWFDAVNTVLAESQRPVTPPIDSPRLAVRSTAGDQFELVVVDGSPQFVSGWSAAQTARTTISHDLLEAALLDGHFDRILAAAQEGQVSAIGNRETLLYFLYHLYPGGPAGAAMLAERIRALTAA